MHMNFTYIFNYSIVYAQYYKNTFLQVRDTGFTTDLQKPTSQSRNVCAELQTWNKQTKESISLFHVTHYIRSTTLH